jgi:hypothetical protein
MESALQRRAGFGSVAERHAASITALPRWAQPLMNVLTVEGGRTGASARRAIAMRASDRSELALRAAPGPKRLNGWHSWNSLAANHAGVTLAHRSSVYEHEAIDKDRGDEEALPHRSIVRDAIGSDYPPRWQSEDEKLG